jgi:molybdenum cofactor guanylyltransferase
VRRRAPAPVGVILAGGRGLRMGGGKLTVALHGRPLIAYPLTAMRTAFAEVAVIAKADTALPEMPGVMLWIEPDQPRHPLLGVVEAIALAGGRPVVVCPGDLPFITASVLVELSQALTDGGPAVIASCKGRTQPLLGCYQPEAANLLAGVARVGEARVRDAIAAIGPKLLEIADPDELFNVNTPEDLLLATAMLDQPNVKS